MAQRDPSIESPPLHIVKPDSESFQPPHDSNVVRGNFLSLRSPYETGRTLKRDEIMRRIGKVAAPVVFKQVDDHDNISWTEINDGDVLSSVPIWTKEDDEGNIKVMFKQVKKGFTGDEFGIFQRGDRGDETVCAVSVSYEAQRRSVTVADILARNLRDKLYDFERKKCSVEGSEELDLLLKEVWPNQKQQATQ